MTMILDIVMFKVKVLADINVKIIDDMKLKVKFC